MNSPPNETILLLEDDPGVARLQRLRLERVAYAVISTATPTEALERLRQGGIDLLVLDNRLAGNEDGLSFYIRLKTDGLELPAILVTGYSDDATVVRALRAGVRDYVFKSVEYLDYLPEAVHRILDQERTKRALRESQEFSRSVLDSLGAQIAVLDREGTIVAVNIAWDRFAAAHNGDKSKCGIGANYLKVCEDAQGPFAEEAPAVARLIRAVLAGESVNNSLEYCCRWLSETRWVTCRSLHSVWMAVEPSCRTRTSRSERRRRRGYSKRLASASKLCKNFGKRATNCDPPPNNSGRRRASRALASWPPASPMN